MGVQSRSVPTYLEKMFELESRRDWLKTLIPEHEDDLPVGELINPNLWAVKGVITPGEPEAIIVANIDDVKIDDPAGKDGKRTIPGVEIAGLFISARRHILLAEHGNRLEDGEVDASLVMPQLALAAVYKQGMNGSPESTFPASPIAEPAGKIATGNSGSIAPIPIPAFNPA